MTIGHTGGALNREKARELGWRSELKPFTEAWFDAMDTCVVPDPRITRIEALCAEAYHWLDGTDSSVSLQRLESILRGNND